jgi:hypothetical protein
MTLMVVPQVAPTASVGGSLKTVVRLERAHTVIVLQGDADASTRRVLSDVLSRVIASRVGDVVIDLNMPAHRVLDVRRLAELIESGQEQR